jgi:hypothetical protein
MVASNRKLNPWITKQALKHPTRNFVPDLL